MYARTTCLFPHNFENATSDAIAKLMRLTSRLGDTLAYVNVENEAKRRSISRCMSYVIVCA